MSTPSAPPSAPKPPAPPARPVRPRRNPFGWPTILVGTLVTVCAVLVLRRDGFAAARDIFLSDTKLLTGQLPRMLAGSLIATFLAFLLPREFVARWVGAESGVIGLFVAVLMGAALPGGPFTIYPVSLMLLSLGADAGAAVAFITAWSLLGYSRALVWEMPFFGSDFVYWRVIAALPLPLVAGLCTRFLVRATGYSFDVDDKP